jgi:hypothetical protein
MSFTFGWLEPPLSATKKICQQVFSRVTVRHQLRSSNMITFQTAPRGTVTVTEANAHARRDQFAALKPLRPPKMKGHTRRYPRFDVGMTTESYIRQFYFLNSIGGGYPFSKTLERAAPMLNPAEPEVEGS